ncbi:MAG: hypothetical protein II075_12035 [Bacteroidales bacterium]|nr:hypothetical protein [Bacteroidales bacterium]
MKKLLLIIVLIIADIALSAAQNNNSNHSQRDVIFLKSGSTVKGQVIDKKDDGSVRVKTGDGHVYHFDGKEVQRIEKETPKANNNQQQQQSDSPQASNSNRQQHGKSGKHNHANTYEHNNPAAQNKTVSQQNQYQSRQSDRRNTFKNKQKDKMPPTYASYGYRFFVEAGFLPGVTCDDGDDHEFTSRALAATSHGFQLSSYMYVGGGIGAEYLLHRSELAIMPFADFRYDFFADLNSPFVGARAGGYLHQGGSGVFFNATVGYHFSRVHLTIGYEIAPYKYLTSTSKTFYEDSKYYNSFLFKISMDWGGR